MSRGKLVISRMSVSGKGMRQRLHTRGRRCSLGLPPAAAGAGRRGQRLHVSQRLRKGRHTSKYSFRPQIEASSSLVLDLWREYYQEKKAREETQNDIAHVLHIAQPFWALLARHWQGKKEPSIQRGRGDCLSNTIDDLDELLDTVIFGKACLQRQGQIFYLLHIIV